MKSTIRKGDYVIVIAGSQKGKKGEVIRVIPSRQMVVVKGVNYIRKAVRKSKEMPQGGFIETEAPIHRSNVMLFCPKVNKGVRVEMIIDKDGVKKRKAKGVDYIFD